jgi:hypothetical protein
MSGESTDSESFPSDNNKRSRSLLRQVRASFVGKSGNRNHIDTTGESSSVLLLRQKRQSYDNIDIQKRRTKKPSRSKTPNSFSHHLSLLNQVKSHFIGTRKYRRTVPSIWTDDDEYHSVPSITSNTVSL